jgi:hypothetical protein
MDDDELTKAQLAWNEAQRVFRTDPTPETKAAYQEASARYNLARHHAKKSNA